MLDDRWVVSNGGPLLLLPTSLLAHWTGTDVPRDGRVVRAHFRWNPDAAGASDYDRACDVRGYVGVLPVGGGWGLVVGDEPNPVCWLPTADGGTLARWVAADDDASVERALARIPEDLAWEPQGDFMVATSPSVLFDSAEPGEESFGPRRTIELRPGSYDVEHATYVADSTTELSLIRLRVRAIR